VRSRPTSARRYAYEDMGRSASRNGNGLIHNNFFRVPPFLAICGGRDAITHGTLIASERIKPQRTPSIQARQGRLGRPRQNIIRRVTRTQERETCSSVEREYEGPLADGRVCDAYAQGHAETALCGVTIRCYTVEEMYLSRRRATTATITTI